MEKLAAPAANQPQDTASDGDSPSSSPPPAEEQHASAATAAMVDRTLHPLLTTTTTPSSRSSVATQAERNHRLHGASLIQSSGLLLRLSPSTVATACVIFHRYYHRVSLKSADVWSVAMGCVLLAGKVEECPARIRDVVTVFHHIYRRRRLRIGCCDANSDGDQQHAQQQQLTAEQKTNLLRYIQPMSPHGPLYKAWSEALLSAENDILRQLGFTLYWIPDHHPHKFILYFLRVLGLDKVNSSSNGHDQETSPASSVAQTSWNYCNDSCLLDVCVRYEPEVIACASIIMATSSATMKALPMQPRPWWEVFIGPNRGDDLIAICNAVLLLEGEDRKDATTTTTVGEIQDAMRGYVLSLVEGSSFTDPGSYLWHNCGI